MLVAYLSLFAQGFIFMGEETNTFESIKHHGFTPYKRMNVLDVFSALFCFSFRIYVERNT